MIKRIISIALLVILPFALLGAVYGYLWWKVSSTFDELASAISPFATLNYVDVHIDPLETEAGIKNVTINPLGMDGDILIDSLVVKAPEWSDLLSFQERLDEGNLPDSLTLKLNNLQFDFNSGYMQDLYRLASQAQMSAGQSYDALGCGDLKYFSLVDLRRMGYIRSRSNLVFSYSFDKDDQQLDFDLESRTDQMINMQFSMALKLATDGLNMQSMMFAQPQLSQVSMRVTDAGYNNNRNRYCASLNEGSVEEYREKYRELFFQRLFDEGWVIPERLLKAVDQLNDPGGALYLSIDLPQGLGPQSMVGITQPSQILDLFNPYVEINGKPHRIEGISWQPPVKKKAAVTDAGEKLQPSDPQMDKKTEVEVERESAAPEQQIDVVTPEDGEEVLEQVSEVSESDMSNKAIVEEVVKKPSFERISVTDSSRYIGKQVKLYTYFGRVVTGKLISSSGKELVVEQRVQLGTATYPIATDKIEKLFVFQ